MNTAVSQPIGRIKSSPNIFREKIEARRHAQAATLSQYAVGVELKSAYGERVTIVAIGTKGATLQSSVDQRAMRTTYRQLRRHWNITTHVLDMDVQEEPTKKGSDKGTRIDE